MYTIIPAHLPARRVRRVRRGWLGRVFRDGLLSALGRIREGALTLRDGGVERRFGRVSDDGALRAGVTVLDPRFYRALALDGALGAGEAYIRGWWACDDLTALIRLMLRNEEAMEGVGGLLARALSVRQRVAHALRDNSRAGSRRNVAAHYDLGEDFYALWLDETMSYSCGVFERDDSTLREASIAKFDRVCRRLRLVPDDHVIEIGGGWGGFALHAAQRYGCRVTTTTVSRRQYDWTARMIGKHGLQSRITLLQQDYRDLAGQYDKLVSIEMIEAVGWRRIGAYLSQCARLLKPDGAACIQAITIADRHYEKAKRSVDFIKRFVFPGSCIPSIGSIACGAARHTDLTLAQVDDITPHYARTLREWRARLSARQDAVARLGYPEEFLRLWDYYLCYCEAGFLERSIGCAQFTLLKPNCRALGTV